MKKPKFQTLGQIKLEKLTLMCFKHPSMMAHTMDRISKYRHGFDYWLRVNKESPYFSAGWLLTYLENLNE